jgi:hypothetical protein
VRESAAVGQPAAQAARSVTGAERQALSFYNRAKEAADTIAGLETAISSMGLAGQTRMALAPNFLQSQEGQAYQQAQRAFTEARLRKESGAAIASHEFENDARMYFAQPGDSKATLEQKEKARAKVLDGLGFTAGKAYDEYYGEPLARAGAVRTPNAQAGGGAPAAPTAPAAGGGLVEMIAPDGGLLHVPANQVAAMEKLNARRK